MLIELRGVNHRYEATEETASVVALRDVDLTIAPGDFAIVMGPSGSGKSTLLNLIGGIDRATDGAVTIGEWNTTRMRDDELTLLRRHQIGFVFQFFNLVPTLTVAENIAFPLALQRKSASEIQARVAHVLEQIALTDRARHLPNQLSGGEMQRVAIGRAIIHRPPLLLADEPTGNLDTETGGRILDLLRQIHGSYRPTVVMATHSERAAAIGDYVIEVVDGRVRSGAARA